MSENDRFRENNEREIKWEQKLISSDEMKWLRSYLFIDHIMV